VSISDKDEFEKWLEVQPFDVVVAVSIRIALRSIPFLGDIAKALRKNPYLASEIILPIFQAIATSRAVIANQGKLFGAALAISTGAVRDANITDSLHVSRSVVADFVTDLVFEIVENTDNLKNITTGSKIFSPTYRSDFIQTVVRAAATGVNTDEFSYSGKLKPINFIDQDYNVIGSSFELRSYMALKLWPQGLPEWATSLWSRLKTSLHQLDEDWEVWTDWYEARLDGRPVNEALEIARVTEITVDEWQQGPKIVNAKIKEIEARFAAAGDLSQSTATTDNEPSLPDQGAGPHFAEKDGQLDHAPSKPTEREGRDETQVKLHTRLKQRFAALSDTTVNLANQYPRLADTLSDYQKYLDVTTLEDIDVPALWMAGAGLIEQARAFSDHDPDTNLTPSLEPETLALLQECSRLHGALIMGFDEGRTLTERSGIPFLDVEALRQIFDSEKEILDALLDSENVTLTDRARELLETLRHQFLVVPVKLENTALVAYPTVRNLLVFIGKMIRGLEAGAVRLSGYGVLVGLPAALLLFLQQHFGAIAGFAQSQPELLEYFNWLYARLGALNSADRDDEDRAD